MRRTPNNYSGIRTNGSNNRKTNTYQTNKEYIRIMQTLWCIYNLSLIRHGADWYKLCMNNTNSRPNRTWINPSPLNSAPGCSGRTAMQTFHAKVKRARPPYFHTPLRALPSDEHNIFAFAAESPYEQAGPETNLVPSEKRKREEVYIIYVYSCISKKKYCSHFVYSYIYVCIFMHTHIFI